MAKGEQKSNKETRKPKKAAPPKQNASNPIDQGCAEQGRSLASQSAQWCLAS